MHLLKNILFKPLDAAEPEAKRPKVEDDAAAMDTGDGTDAPAAPAAAAAADGDGDVAMGGAGAATTGAAARDAAFEMIYELLKPRGPRGRQLWQELNNEVFVKYMRRRVKQPLVGAAANTLAGRAALAGTPSRLRRRWSRGKHPPARRRLGIGRKLAIGPKGKGTSGNDDDMGAVGTSLKSPSSGQ